MFNRPLCFAVGIGSLLLVMGCGADKQAVSAVNQAAADVTALEKKIASFEQDVRRLRTEVKTALTDLEAFQKKALAEAQAATSAADDSKASSDAAKQSFDRLSAEVSRFNTVYSDNRIILEGGDGPIELKYLPIGTKIFITNSEPLEFMKPSLWRYWKGTHPLSFTGAIEVNQQRFTGVQPITIFVEASVHTDRGQLFLRTKQMTYKSSTGTTITTDIHGYFKNNQGWEGHPIDGWDSSWQSFRFQPKTVSGFIFLTKPFYFE